MSKLLIDLVDELLPTKGGKIFFIINISSEGHLYVKNVTELWSYLKMCKISMLELYISELKKSK